MQRSTDRIHTTHVGSLPRPSGLLDLMRAKAQGQEADPGKLAEAERQAVADTVARQRAAGVDVICDGEQSKTGFFAYVAERLSGFEPNPGSSTVKFQAETEAFPEYYEQYFKRAMTGGAAVSLAPLSCTGPVEYIGHDRLSRDLDNLRTAVGNAEPDEVFVPSVAPSGVGGNAYYATEDAYLDAVADALHVEHRSIGDVD